jgi:hypothetical protein
MAASHARQAYRADQGKKRKKSRVDTIHCTVKCLVKALKLFCT